MIIRIVMIVMIISNAKSINKILKLALSLDVSFAVSFTFKDVGMITILKQSMFLSFLIVRTALKSSS